MKTLRLTDVFNVSSTVKLKTLIDGAIERLMDENTAALPPSLHPLCRRNRPREPVTNPFTNLQSDSRHSNAVCISEHAHVTWVMSQEALIAPPI